MSERRELKIALGLIKRHCAKLAVIMETTTSARIFQRAEHEFRREQNRAEEIRLQLAQLID